MAHILLIEDNPIDARLIQRFIPGSVTWIDDGQKALWYLQSLEASRVENRPDLVLLDLNLPKYNGLEVLEAFRRSESAWHLPVFLLSSMPSNEIADLARSQNLQAEAYIEKPCGLAGFEQLAERVLEVTDASFSAARTVAA